MTIDDKTKEELKNKGQELISAAYEFWEVHQNIEGPRAVVWLEASDGHFVLFTRGEYKNKIMSVVETLNEEIPLDEPFVEKNIEENRWIPIKEREPEIKERVLAVVQHWHTKGRRIYELYRVDESDVHWRTVDDNSEISYDWNVTHWKRYNFPEEN